MILLIASLSALCIGGLLLFVFFEYKRYQDDKKTQTLIDAYAFLENKYPKLHVYPAGQVRLVIEREFELIQKHPQLLERLTALVTQREEAERIVKRLIEARALRLTNEPVQQEFLGKRIND